jgi:UDP-N-acetylglucosamine 1-carboxyvinyltransferase
MEKLVITGGNKIQGTISVSGAKNVALKALVAACLTQEEVTINNIPKITDFFVMVDIMKNLGAKISIEDHCAKISVPSIPSSTLPLEDAIKARTSAMFIAPLLARLKEANLPNPGGCRLGARPIDRIIEGIAAMGAEVTYNSEDGYFHATTTGLRGIEYTFEKSTHTGTETLLLAAVLATGKTVLKNAAEEPEIDELIAFLNAMGAQVTRSGKREITIIGVEQLHGASMTILPDRNEIITFAIAGLVTGGDVTIKDATKVDLKAFLEKLTEAGAGYEIIGDDIRFFSTGKLLATNVTTAIYPGFMTDWQAPWAVLMTQATGESVVHETVFENKLGYVQDLKRMGAKVTLFNPQLTNKEDVYNFNLEDDKPEYFHAVRVIGPSKLHEFIATTLDIRAGAAVVLAALAAKGTSTIFGVEKLDRGYEKFEERLSSLGANIKRVQEN